MCWHLIATEKKGILSKTMFKVLPVQKVQPSIYICRLGRGLKRIFLDSILWIKHNQVPVFVLPIRKRQMFSPTRVLNQPFAVVAV